MSRDIHFNLFSQQHNTGEKKTQLVWQRINNPFYFSFFSIKYQCITAGFVIARVGFCPFFSPVYRFKTSSRLKQAGTEIPGREPWERPCSKDVRTVFIGVTPSDWSIKSTLFYWESVGNITKNFESLVLFSSETDSLLFPQVVVSIRGDLDVTCDCFCWTCLLLSVLLVSCHVP